MALYTSYMKRRYDNGGKFANASAISGGIAQGLGTIGEMVGAANPPDRYGVQSKGVNVAQDVGRYAALGASIGSAFPGLGTAIGAGAGALVGVTSGLIRSGRQRRLGERMRAQEQRDFYNESMEQYKARAAADPESAYGIRGAEYFANGGSLFTKYMYRKAMGGSLSRLSSDSVDVHGPSHANGGVTLPNVGAEVEGGETINNGYVMSKRLGFADAHRPVAKAIGQLENRAPTRNNLEAIRRLRQREDALRMMQERVREQYNLE